MRWWELIGGQSHQFLVRAANDVAVSSPARVLATPMPAAMPQNLRAAPRDGGADLWWEFESQPDHRYEYTQDGGASWQSTMNGAFKRVRISSLTNGRAYTFRVRATRHGLASLASQAVTVIPSPLPAAPTGLMATRSGGTVTLSWEAPDPAEPWVTKYQYPAEPRMGGCAAKRFGHSEFHLGGS